MRLPCLALPYRRLLQLVAGLATLASLASVALAQSYPAKSVIVVVPFAAGGPSDVIARLLAEHAQAALGQPFIIENVTGAAGSTGSGRVAKAAPDGYTLVLSSVSTHVLNGAVYPKLGYRVIDDFTPIIQVTSSPMFIVARKTLPANNLKELIAWLKANPDKATQGFYGIGNMSHVGGVYFQKETGTKFAFVNYKGANPAMQDLLGGQIDFIVDLSASAVPQIAAGTIKGFAVTSKTRMAQVPDVPTTDEAGLPGFHMMLWNAFWAPKGTPESIVAKLNATFAAALADPKVRAKLADLGQEIPPPEQQTPEALLALQRAEAKKWWPLMKANNIKVE
jgi:tripartite-type tricarboxylate transporter receptor subunit TctC